MEEKSYRTQLSQLLTGVASAVTDVDDDSIDALVAETQKDIADAKQRHDEQQVRILQNTLDWLRFLDSQAVKLTDIARKLYQRLLACKADLASLIPQEEEALGNLEWVLVGLQSWIEQQKPEGEEVRFHLAPGDGGEVYAFWQKTRQTALRRVIQDLAEVDGEFPAEVAVAIADQLVGDLYKGDIELPHVRRLREDSETTEVKFELMERGSLFTDEVAVAEQEQEDAPWMPSHIQVRLGYQAQELERVLKNAILSDDEDRDSVAEPDSDFASPGPAALTAEELTGRLVQIVEPTAVRLHLTAEETVECLYVVADRGARSSLRSGDSMRMVKYAQMRALLDPVVVKLFET